MVAIGLVMALAPVPAAAASPGGGGPGFAGSSGDAESPRPASAARQPVGALPGIDVSHHQDAIDWAQVAASGQRFAIAKATEGTSFVDPMYATNKAGAEANGIAFGAYHFARPDATPNDAELEADHFVDTALLQPGNLVPVLDIERTGGLSQAEITTWILGARDGSARRPADGLHEPERLGHADRRHDRRGRRRLHGPVGGALGRRGAAAAGERLER
jgi:GH25 family lysozyme M1 (1,4-beta-N-acetylmuramidase)